MAANEPGDAAKNEHNAAEVQNTGGIYGAGVTAADANEKIESQNEEGAEEKITDDGDKKTGTKDKKGKTKKGDFDEPAKKEEMKKKKKKKKKKKGGGLLSSMMSVFTKQKKNEEKVWVAVPGALPSGKMDQQLWRDLVEHFDSVVKKAVLSEPVVRHPIGGGDDGSSAPSAGSGDRTETLSTPFWAHFNLAMCCDCRGDHVGAIRQYRNALKMRPDNVGLRYRLGVLLALVRGEDEEQWPDNATEEEEVGTGGDGNGDVGLKRPESAAHEEEENEQRRPRRYKPSESVVHLVQVVEADPNHSGALFELAAVQQDRKNYKDAIELLRRAVKGEESVAEVLERQFLGAPTISDAKATLAGALSLQAYGNDDSFDLRHIGSETGAYDPDKPAMVDLGRWREAQDLFRQLDDAQHRGDYLPPIISHVLGPAPDQLE